MASNKLYERVVRNDALKKEEEQTEETRLVKDEFQEYGEIRVPKTWTHPPSLMDLQHDIDGAIIEHDLIIDEINEHLDYYHTNPGAGRPHKIKGRSNAQPQSIRKAAEWRYATLSEPFLDSPDIFKGEPTTYVDVDGTKEAEQILNYQFRNQIGLVEFIDGYIKDMVDTGTGIIRTSWELVERKKEVEQDIVNYVPDNRLAPLYTRLMEMLSKDPAQFKESVPEDIKLALKKSMEQQKPLRREVLGTETVTVIETIKNQPKLEVCDYRDVIPDPTCRGIQEDMKFCGYRIRTTKADLKTDPRYFNVDDIVVKTAAVVRQDALDTDSEDMDQDSDTFQFKDPNRQPIEGIEYWGFVDVDDSGILTPVVFTWFGNTLVRAEENPYPDKQIPFIFVPYLKKRNSLYGEPDGALLQEDQKISGAITRGVIDILAKNANGQRGIPKGALDYSNLMLYREGKDYEFNPTTPQGRDGITQITKFPEIPQSAIAVQQLAEQNIKEMVGTVRGEGSQNQGNYIGTQASPAQVAGMSKAARRELGILRRISDGIIKVGHKICEMNREFLNDEEFIRITDGSFANVKRKHLDCRYDLTLSISTAEDDSTKAQELAFLLQTSTGVMDQDFVRELLADIADLRRMPDKAAKYRAYQPQPDPIQQQISQLQVAKLQAEIAEIQGRTVENQAEAQREQAHAEKHLADAKLSSAKADAVNLKYVEDETGVSHQRDVEKQMAQAKGNMMLESHKTDLDSRRANEERAAKTEQQPLTTEENASTNAASPNTNTSPTIENDFDAEAFETELDRISNVETLI
jgi:hypothetical protein